MYRTPTLLMCFLLSGKYSDTTSGLNHTQILFFLLAMLELTSCTVSSRASGSARIEIRLWDSIGTRATRQPYLQERGTKSAGRLIERSCRFHFVAKSATTPAPAGITTRARG